MLIINISFSENTHEMCCVQVDSSSVPWDFFISSKITSDDDDDVHVSCYLYDNGCLTLWRTPNEVTVEVLTLFSD